ncbi:MAG: response regulator [Candidatus Sericytochromatia bacterium]|nr:response regulator [Candidatus Sericytochromatia bacterium]
MNLKILFLHSLPQEPLELKPWKDTLVPAVVQIAFLDRGNLLLQLTEQPWDIVCCLEQTADCEDLLSIKELQNQMEAEWPLVWVGYEQDFSRHHIAFELGADAYLPFVDLLSPSGLNGLLQAQMNRKRCLQSHKEKQNLQAELNIQTQQLLLAGYLAEESHRRTQLLKDVATQANAPGSLEQMLLSVLEQICFYTSWPVGHVFLCHTPVGKRIERLKSSAIWALSEQEVFESFSLDPQVDLMPWEGLPGLVYTRQRPAWHDFSLNQTGDKLFSHRYVRALQFDFKSQLAFPIMVKDKVVAVLEFFSLAHEHPGEDLLALLTLVGEQISYAIERKKVVNMLQLSQERLQHAHRLAQLGAWEWNRSLDQFWLSDEIYEMAEIEPEVPVDQLKGAFCARIHPDDLAGFLAQISDAVANQSIFRMDHRLLLPSYQVLYVHSECQLVPDDLGQQVILQGVMQNITARKQQELELEKLRQQADAANLAKSNFIANMSHEIRTPLNAVLGCTQLLQQTMGLSVKQLGYLETIFLSGEHLLKLINEILEMSKIESGYVSYNPAPCHLATLLTQIQAIFQHQAAQNPDLNLFFDYSEGLPGLILTDEGKLRQVLLHLLGNAIKFTQAGSVSLRVRYHQGLLHFEIEDTGSGIGLKEQALLFHSFVQTQSGRDLHKGAGLGLVLSQRYVHLLGGNIAVSSGLGQGSCFSFSIPVEAIAGIAETPPSEEQKLVEPLAQSEVHYRILVVDDKAINRQIVAEVLDLPTVSVREACNGQEAFEIQQDWHPHLILMDMFMPVMGGKEAVELIRQKESGQPCIIILLTASSLDSECLETLALGANDILLKPFKLGDLCQKISQYLPIPFSQNFAVQAPLTGLNEDLRARLYQAALAADQEFIFDSLAGIDCKNASLVKKIRDFAENFQYDQLIEFLEKN